MTEGLHEPHILAEINKNQEAFDKVREAMEGGHWSKTVLMHDGAVVAIYNDHGMPTRLAARSLAWASSAYIWWDSSLWTSGSMLYP